VIQAHTRVNAATADEFLDTLQHHMPFPIRCSRWRKRVPLPSSNLDCRAACACSSCRQALQTQGYVGACQPHPHRGVLPSHCLLAGDETAQSRVAPVGKDLQHRLRTSSSWLPPALQFPSALISTKGMKPSAIFRASAESSALGTFSVHSIRVRTWGVSLKTVSQKHDHLGWTCWDLVPPDFAANRSYAV
jgi:hypothetical protein